MTRRSRVTTTILLAIASFGVKAAETTYVFDTVSRFDQGSGDSSLTGILRNTTTPFTATFIHHTTDDVVSRCVPVFLIMLEKPGRYFLNLTIDPAHATMGLVSCGLELRS